MANERTRLFGRPVLLVDNGDGTFSVAVAGTGVGGAAVVDTEMPAAVAAADNMGNPTAPQVLAHLMAFDGTTWDRVRGVTNADNQTPTVLIPVQANSYLFDGTNSDRERPNTEETILTSAARTADQTVNATNFNARGAIFVIDVTAIAATPSITVTIRGRDTLSGQTYDILTGVAITAVSKQTLKVYPGMTAAANTVANEPLPREFQVFVDHLDADSITYSIAALTIL